MLRALTPALDHGPRNLLFVQEKPQGAEGEISRETRAGVRGPQPLLLLLPERCFW